MTYRAAIVGLGAIGMERAPGAPRSPLAEPMPVSHAHAYHAIGAAEVVAACDLNRRLLEQFTETWGDAWPEARVYTDFRAMLGAERIDLLSVVTPDYAHADLVVEAAKAGVRGILCEKPLATSLADADRMIAAVESAGIPMVIDHTRRYWPLYHQARDLLRERAIGPPRRVSAALGGPRAMLFRMGTHLVDTVCFLADDEPNWVMAALDPGYEDYTEYRGDGGHDPATEPSGSALVEFAGGCRALLDLCRGGSQEFAITLTGETGRIHVTDSALDLMQGDPPAARRIRKRSYRHEGIAAAVMELARLVEQGGESVSPPEAGRRTLAILLGMLESEQRGGARVSLKPEASR